MPDLMASAVNDVKREVGDILGSGNYYVTPELTRELSSIQTGLNHLQLESNLTSTSARPAQSASASFNPQLARSLDDAGRILSGVRSKLDAKNISNMQANQIRDAHHKSMVDLINVKDGINQYAHGAHQRINQFSDHIGVTDRFTAYRSNLTRGSKDPIKLDSYWQKRLSNQRVKFDDTGINRGMSAPTQRSSFNPYQTSKVTMQSNESIPKSPPKVHFNTSQQRPYTTPVAVKPASTRSIQEQCGINTVFPGKTEYMTRYNQPPSLRNMGTGFTINPTPNYLIYGRPIAKMVYHPSYTEYQSRYEWPDGSKIVKLPWLQK